MIKVRNALAALFCLGAAACTDTPPVPLSTAPAAVQSGNAYAELSCPSGYVSTFNPVRNVGSYCLPEPRTPIDITPLRMQTEGLPARAPTRTPAQRWNDAAAAALILQEQQRLSQQQHGAASHGGGRVTIGHGARVQGTISTSGSGANVNVGGITGPGWR